MKYIDALKSTIDSWNENPIADEWAFEKFRKEHIDLMSPVEAFDAIGATVPYLVQEGDESTACEILQSILNLAAKAETTELHSALHGEIVGIDEKFSMYGEYAKSKLLELKKYYRMS